MTSEPLAKDIDGRAERAFDKVKRDVVSLKSDVIKLKKVFKLKGDIDYVHTLERIRLELQNLDTKIEMNKIEVSKFMSKYSFSEGEVKYLREEVIPIARQVKENMIEINSIKELLKKGHELNQLETDNKVADLRLEMDSMRKELLEEISYLRKELREARKTNRVTVVEEKEAPPAPVMTQNKVIENRIEDLEEEREPKKGFGKWLFFKEDEIDSIERIKNEVQ